jgi:hypothetical protein
MLSVTLLMQYRHPLPTSLLQDLQEGVTILWPQSPGLIFTGNLRVNWKFPAVGRSSRCEAVHVFLDTRGNTAPPLPWPAHCHPGSISVGADRAGVPQNALFGEISHLRLDSSTLKRV